jgi:hypothetical protein
VERYRNSRPRRGGEGAREELASATNRPVMRPDAGGERGKWPSNNKRTVVWLTEQGAGGGESR